MTHQDSKQTYYLIAIAIVVLIIFNAIYFASMGTDGNASAWITYGFMSISLLSIIAFNAIHFNKMEVKMRAVFNSVIYCIIELLVGVIILLINPETVVWTIVVQGTIFGIALIAQLMCLFIDNQR